MVYSIVGVSVLYVYVIVYVFFFQAEDGIRDLVRSRGLGDVYKRQRWPCSSSSAICCPVSALEMMVPTGMRISMSGPALSLIHI